MKLLDAANVNPDDRRWMLGDNRSSRACGVQVSLEDPCDPAIIQMVNSNTTRPGSYYVSPFAIRARLTRPVTCAEPDDLSWTLAALNEVTEMALGRALVTQVNDAAESWVGGTGVQNVVIAGAPTPTAAQLGTAISAAREQWFKTVVSPGGPPILHVPPKMLIAAEASGAVKVTGPEEVISIWGQPVVVNPGYDIAAPYIFFTPAKPVIWLSDVDDEGGAVSKAQINQTDIFANRIAAIDIPPCAIVRVGA